MEIPFPNYDDFVRIGASFPYGLSPISTDDIISLRKDTVSSAQFLAIFDILTWVNSANFGIAHIRRSYTFVKFYHEQGAPEHIHFGEYNDNDILLRDYFYYFSDVLFHKIFSTWDTIGHIVNFAFRLHVNKPDFEKVVDKLKQKDPSLYARYTKITSNNYYKEAKQIRNGLTHNVPLGVVDQRPVQVGPKTTYFGTSKYIPPSEIIETANQAIRLLEETVILTFGEGKKNQE